MDSQQKRRFGGSKVVLGSAIGLFVVALIPTVQTGTGWMAFVKLGGYFITGAAAYLFAGMIPEHEIARRKRERLKNKQGTLGDMLIRVLDGTRKTTHEEDMGNFLVITFVVSLISAILIWPLAIVNFIRNRDYLLNAQSARDSEPAG